MFTGIITDIGTILSVERHGDLKVRIGTNYDTARINLGASICCDGVCLTVTNLGSDWFETDISAETVSKTNISAQNWGSGHQINLERSVRVGDELGGHIVSGHVDGTARIIAMVEDGASTRVTFDMPQNLAHFIAPKGSVALNGTSLTINHVSGQNFDINFIPHTKNTTTWAAARVGDIVNMEVDMLARYVARLHEWQNNSK